MHVDRCVKTIRENYERGLLKVFLQRTSKPFLLEVKIEFVCFYFLTNFVHKYSDFLKQEQRANERCVENKINLLCEPGRGLQALTACKRKPLVCNNLKVQIFLLSLYKVCSSALRFRGLRLHANRYW